MRKKVFLIVGFLLLAGLITILFLLNRYLSNFAREVKLSKREVIGQLTDGFRNPYQGPYLTFLILGLDQRPGENSLLTDTILLATIDTQTGNYLLFSIPRDLWLDDLKTKINALYYYGQKRDPNDGTQLVKKRLEEILDWPIDYTILLGMDQIKELINLAGGIEVEVERGFVDQKFPKDDGSGEVMTVEFKAGRQVFDGERALQFMRSRKSRDPIEGTDEARQRRQKKVILALKSKLLRDRDTFLQPKMAGKLYQFLIEKVRVWPQIDLRTLASFWQVGLKAIKGNQIEAEIPWREDDAILVPGKDPIYNTWILKPRNSDWGVIKRYFKQKLLELK